VCRNGEAEHENGENGAHGDEGKGFEGRGSSRLFVADAREEEYHAECNHEQIDMIRRDVRSGLEANARPVLLEDLVADPVGSLAGAWGVVTTDCHRAEVEAAARTVGLPVYRVALDAEFPQAILRWAKTRDVVMAVGDERFAGVFLRFLGQLGAAPEVIARVRIVVPARLRAALRAASDDAVVLVSRLVHDDVEAKLPLHARHLAAHWRLAPGTLDRLRAELAYDLAAKREGHAQDASSPRFSS